LALEVALESVGPNGLGAPGGQSPGLPPC